MALSIPVERRAVHRRTVETRAYRRSDGLWDVEAHLRDTKAFDSEDFRRGRIPAGEPIHDMWVRVTIDADLVVRHVESSSDAAPFTACAAPADEFAALVGAPLARGWRARVYETFGGRQSCTHLVSLFEPIATTAFQALCGGDDPQGADPLAAPRHRLQKPFFIDGCRVWRAEGGDGRDRVPRCGLARRRPAMKDAIFSLQGRTVLVSGASSGIGLHVAQIFAAAGAAVALAARRTERTAPAAAALEAAGHRAASVYLDVTDETTVGPAFDEAHRLLGAPVDVLVNNAGVLHAESFVGHAGKDLDRVIDTNLKGAFRVAQEAARRMLVLRRGSIVNVASTAGLRAGAFMASYAASKAGLIHLSQVMALELAGKNIRVNVLCPGNIDTDMQAVLGEKGFNEAMLKRTPMRRFGQLDDLDGAFLLLASDAGRYMTGAVITVDGGQTLSWM